MHNLTLRNWGHFDVMNFPFKLAKYTVKINLCYEIYSSNLFKLVFYTCQILICTEFTNNGDGIDLRCYKNRDQLYTNNRVLTVYYKSTDNPESSMLDQVQDTDVRCSIWTQRTRRRGDCPLRIEMFLAI